MTNEKVAKQYKAAAIHKAGVLFINLCRLSEQVRPEVVGDLVAAVNNFVQCVVVRERFLPKNKRSK
jgi:hypothetical protein